MFVGYASNHEGDCFRMWNPKSKKVSKTHDVVFLNRMFFKTPKKQVIEKQVPNNADLESVQQDKRGGTMTADFITGNNNASMVESIDSSVLDTPIVNSNPEQSKYGWAYRCIMHYDPATGRTIGVEATALASYCQCLKDTDGETEFANGAGMKGV
jgi:hypothetical protein